MSSGEVLGLWLAVVALGAYHGLNPAMGWPLAVANGLADRRDRSVLMTVLPLGAGHLLAMAVVLVPFALLTRYVEWNRELRMGAGALVLLFGVYRLVQRRHPRSLARIKPTQLTLWSFLMATAHGAAFMLLPVTLGLCADNTGAVNSLAGSGLSTAVTVALVHSAAMFGTGLGIAWVVYRYLGLQFLRRGWFNLDVVWAASLVVSGGLGWASAAFSRAT